jgi:hypothetical protein
VRQELTTLLMLGGAMFWAIVLVLAVCLSVQRHDARRRAELERARDRRRHVPHDRVTFVVDDGFLPTDEGQRVKQVLYGHRSGRVEVGLINCPISVEPSEPSATIFTTEVWS